MSVHVLQVFHYSIFIWGCKVNVTSQYFDPSHFLKIRSPKSLREHSGPLYKGFGTSDPQRNVMRQSTEMSPLVAMLFWTFLNPLKF